LSDLLPHLLRQTIATRTVFSASESFGVVTFVVLVVLLIEAEALRVAHAARGRHVTLTVVSVPLLVALALTIVARLSLIIH
jgi:hypothetical protein